MIDFIIVGGGIAGISFAETLFKADKSFVVISDASQNSSLVAAGIYNPVILKRFSITQDAKEHLEFIKPFYKSIEERLSVALDFPVPIHRRFTGVEEQNGWFEAMDKPRLEPFLSPDIVHADFEGLSTPFGLGRVLCTGYVDTQVLVQYYHAFLTSQNKLHTETFDYNMLLIEDSKITYGGIVAKHIVFAEGFGLNANPYFNYLPLDGTKGELLLIKAPDLKLDVAINSGVFILPVGNGFFKVGATYEWDDKTAVPTAAGKAELVEKLEAIITCNYEVIDHFAGVRPTVKDRKPLVGTHHIHKNVHLLNGLGTRGVMLGPPLAAELYHSIIEGVPVKKEINLNRFKV
ncbi:MAG: FAD-binding oxidoreductase [Bacteroidota bacterium]